MASKIRKDPLLAAAKVIMIILQLLLGIVFLALLVAIPGFLLSSSHVEANMLDAARGNLPQALIAIEALVLVGLVVSGAAFYFVRQLARIIGTVGEGEPFVEENARRLSRMGWVTAAIQVFAVPVTALTSYLRPMFPEGTIDIEAGISFNGIVLAVTLFILARVFRKGTEMREDLEGTV